MKARKFQFKSVPMVDQIWDDRNEKFISRNEGTLVYHAMLRSVVSSPGPTGLTSIQVVKSAVIVTSLHEALLKKKKHIWLSAEDFSHVLDRLEVMTWAKPMPCIIEFIDYLKKLPEEEVVVK